MCGHSFAFLAPKALFLPPLETTTTTQIDPRYTLLPSLGVQLSGEVPFVIFEWLVWELPPDNQRVSISVFSVSSYILVLRVHKLHALSFTLTLKHRIALDDLYYALLNWTIFRQI